jgi:tetratricopeptide (TPR) repeat protein
VSFAPAVAAVLLLVAGGAAKEPVARGEAALDAGRYEDARALFEAALAAGADYDALVGLGVALGRLGQLEAALEPLEQAIALDGQRPEAWIEHGGVRFLQSSFSDAVADLEKALALQDDAYARGLLATSLHLTGRTGAALSQWNILGEPRLRHLSISGLQHTRATLVRQAIPLREGKLLDARQVREARLRLKELAVFDRVTLRPVPLAGGQADLEVALVDRKGLARSIPEFVALSGVNALSKLARLRYVNLLGRGLTVGAYYRWDQGRPALGLSLDWPRPFGWGGRLALQSARGKQEFSLDEPLERSLRTLRLSYRFVVDDRTLLELSARSDWRSFSVARADAPEGNAVGLNLGLERLLVDARRVRLELDTGFWLAVAGSAEPFARADGALTAHVAVGPGRQGDIERSVFAARAFVGGASGRAPVDEWFAPGASDVMEVPLRGHDQTERGVLGGTPLSRSVAAMSVEWRQRIVKGFAGELSVVGFLDSVWLEGPVLSAPEAEGHRWYQDAGIGLRLGRPGSGAIRLDLGYGLVDGKKAVSVGLRQAF